MLELIYEGHKLWKEGRKLDKIYCEIFPSFHWLHQRNEHTIVSLFIKGKTKIESILWSHVSSLLSEGTNIIAQIPEGEYKHFHLHV